MISQKISEYFFLLFSFIYSSIFIYISDYAMEDKYFFHHVLCDKILNVYFPFNYLILRKNFYVFLCIV